MIFCIVYGMVLSYIGETQEVKVFVAGVNEEMSMTSRRKYVIVNNILLVVTP